MGYDIHSKYDLNGNLTNEGYRTYSWDEENRLIAIVGAKSLSPGPSF